MIFRGIMYFKADKVHPAGSNVTKGKKSGTIQMQRYAADCLRIIKGREKQMKLTMNRIAQGEDEVIIKYREINEQIEALVGIVEGKGHRISAYGDGQVHLLFPEHIYYLESVDGVTFAYLKDKVYKIQMSLFELTLCYESRGFFRCSKSMVINIYKIIEVFLRGFPAHLLSEGVAELEDFIYNGNGRVGDAETIA